MLHVGSDQSSQQQQIVEAASPISSRPPATAAAGSLEELMRLSVEEDAALAAAGEEGDRGGGSGGAGGISGNRWPRQETLALLKIRSDMDAVFRDATIKGPLWEEVSRKLAELGYNRSAKKCKEKFENVHKYYKRTKEGRAGRQDGKSYKFFTQLEALHGSSSTNLSASPSIAAAAAAAAPAHVPATLDVAPVSVGIPGPMPISSVLNIPPHSFSLSNFPASSSAAPNIHVFHPAAVSGSAPAPPPSAAAVPAQFGVSFSSNSSSSSPGSDDDDDGDEDDEFFAGEPSGAAAATTRKRKRSSQSSKRGSGDDERMMEFFEGLMKQVMQKQEAMQQSFLEAIEKREQDRMIREEAWKRQEMARLAREQELMAQERAISASRDAAIISFLQKITGQTIELPPQVPAPPAPSSHPAPSTLATAHVTVQAKPVNPPASMPQQQHHPRQTEKIITETVADERQHSIASQALVAIPEQQRPVPHAVQEDQIGASGSSEPPSSRWPKTEVLALISIRGGLESRYQEAGPKGPLWEEISAGMQRMGYQRSAKRCKEKWENINKYFKKVKESNKKRPDDAKTCPYFHQLDALYRQKTLGGSSATTGGSGGGTSSISFTKQLQPERVPATNILLQVEGTDGPASESENKNGGSNAGATELQARTEGFTGNLFGEGSEAGATKKPEDIVNELMEQQRASMVYEHEKMEETDSDQNVEDEEEDEETEDERKMSYKIEFQPQNTGASNGHGFHSQRLSEVHHFIS